LEKERLAGESKRPNIRDDKDKILTTGLPEEVSGSVSSTPDRQSSPSLSNKKTGDYSKGSSPHKDPTDEVLKGMKVNPRQVKINASLAPDQQPSSSRPSLPISSGIVDCSLALLFYFLRSSYPFVLKPVFRY
jgi:hypothetical protein